MVTESVVRLTLEGAFVLDAVELGAALSELEPGVDNPPLLPLFEAGRAESAIVDEG